MGGLHRSRRDVESHAVDVEYLPPHELVDGPPLHGSKHLPLKYVVPPDEFEYQLPLHQGHNNPYPVFSHFPLKYEFITNNQNKETVLTLLHETAVTDEPPTTEYLVETDGTDDGGSVPDNIPTIGLSSSTSSLPTSTRVTTSLRAFKTATAPGLTPVPKAPGIVIGGQCECSCPCMDPYWNPDSFWLTEPSTSLKSEMTDLTTTETSSIVPESSSTSYSSFSTEPDSTVSSTSEQSIGSSIEHSTTNDYTFSEEISTETRPSSSETIPTDSSSSPHSLSSTEMYTPSSTSTTDASSTMSSSSISVTEESSTSDTSTSVTTEEPSSSTASEIACTPPPPMILVLEGEN